MLKEFELSWSPCMHCDVAKYIMVELDVLNNLNPTLLMEGDRTESGRFMYI